MTYLDYEDDAKCTILQFDGKRYVDVEWVAKFTASMKAVISLLGGELDADFVKEMRTTRLDDEITLGTSIFGNRKVKLRSLP